MALNLKKPLVVFDVESTGLDIVNDRIIELSYVKVWPNGKEERMTYRFNPDGRAISPEAQAIHKISLEDLVDKPCFKEKADELLAVFVDADIAGFNSNRFDIPILAEEFLRAGKEFNANRHHFVDAQIIYHKKERRDLEAAYRFYCGKEMENHHAASCDTDVTYEVLKAQIEHYEDLDGKSIEELSREYSSHTLNVDFSGRFVWTNEKKVAVAINFGKYKGQLASEVFARDLGYYNWISNAEFTLDTKRVATLIKLNQLDKLK